MNGGDGMADLSKWHFAIREPDGMLRRCDLFEWLRWRKSNHNMSVMVHATMLDRECGAAVFFYGISDCPDRPMEFWTCTATAHRGPHDGAVWSCKCTSELEAIEKSRWLVKYFADHDRFPDGPELELDGK
jgi:hypothetical protein